jgi:hypothetical protein
VFDWLFEGRTAVYCLIGVVAAMLFLVWWRTRKRNVLLAASGVAALAVAYFVLGQFVQTPRKQIERHLKEEIPAAVKAHDADAIFKHITADFKFRGSDRAAFRGLVEMGLKSGFINELVIYDIDFPSGGDSRTIPVEFMAKAKPGFSDANPAYPVRATFVREPDGQWRMKGCEVYDPVATNQPLSLPNMP